MGTYALGAHLAERDGRDIPSKAGELIRTLRNQGRLQALPIRATDEAHCTLIAQDGTELREYGSSGSGRWVSKGPLGDGAIRYLGSASHAGHIELKALWVLYDKVWYNIITESPADEIC